MNLSDNLLAQIRSGAITIGEALESLPEALRQSVMKNIRSGALTPYEALEGASSDYNKLGAKYGPPQMQGPPKPQVRAGVSGLPNVSLPSASDIGSGAVSFLGKIATRANPYMAAFREALESKPLNAGEEAAFQAYLKNASGTTASLNTQAPPAQTREPLYTSSTNYPGREPNQEAWEKAQYLPARDKDTSPYSGPTSAPRIPSSRAAASAPISQTGNNVYYLDRGDGSPVMPMGTQLPKGMSSGAQPGGGYIFGLNTPAPTNAVSRVMQRGLGIKQPSEPTGPVDPLTRKAYAPVSAPKPEESAKDMDYGDRTPPLARKKEFDLPNAPQERRGGPIHGPHMAAGGTPCHSGIINMAVGGRTDHIPMNVLEGSYVLPADIVSGLGEGNTMAGSKILDAMMKTGPAGVKLPSFRASPRFPEPTYTAPKQNPYAPPKVAARGGAMESNLRPVPIVAAGGEYVVSPDVVTALGNGDMNRGHEYLDNFVKYVRSHLVKTLSKLPGPRRD